MSPPSGSDDRHAAYLLALVRGVVPGIGNPFYRAVQKAGKVRRLSVFRRIRIGNRQPLRRGD